MAGTICAVTDTINLIGTRPRLLIIQHLGGETRSFTDLKHRTGLSSRTLSLNLRFLEAQGIVTREEKAYALTRSGATLIPLLTRFGEWGKHALRVGA